MKKIVIFGGACRARLAYAFLSFDSQHQIDCFTVHKKYIEREKMMGLDIIPFETIESTNPPDAFSMFIAIGYKKLNKIRAEIYENCKQKGYEFITYISRKTNIWNFNDIGANCFIYGAGSIQPYVNIGDNVVIGGASISHDTVIENHCYISPHAVISGNVRIGERSFIGANATIRDGVAIAPRCVIGAGAVIMNDTQPGEVYLGPKSTATNISSSQLKMFQ